MEHFSSVQTPPPLLTSINATELVEWTLRIPEILENILEKLDLRSLLICRRVSRNWNFEANKFLRNQARIRRLEGQGMLRDFEDTMKSSVEGISLPVHHLSFYLTCKHGNLENFLNPVRHHVKVVKWLIHADWNAVDEMTRLLYNFLPNLEALFIDFEPNYELHNNAFQSKKILPHFRKTLPTLNSISIEIEAVQFAQSPNNVFTFSKMFVASAVNLKWLHLSRYETPHVAAVQADILSSVSSSTVGKLEMDDFWAVENISALLSHPLDFPLTVLILQMVSIEEGVLKSLLKRFCGSLVELNLTVSEKHVHYNFPFAIMRKLKTLKIGDAGDFFRIDWSLLPQLRRLELHHCSLRGILAPMLSCSRYACHLETLHMNSLRIALRKLPLVKQVLSHVNSQLTRLEIKIWNDFTPRLAVVFKKCTRLTHLSLMSDWNNLDQQLCGVDRLKMSSRTNWPNARLQLQANLDISYINLVAYAEQQHVFPNLGRSPFLGNLKDLQVLKLRGAFSELAILHGVIHCKNLRKIKLFSFEMKVDRAVGIIRHGGLIHLTSLKINHVFENHLP